MTRRHSRLSALAFRPCFFASTAVGTPIACTRTPNGEVFSGEVAGAFQDAEPFKFLPAIPEPLAN
jgi:hypothetical protein